MLSPVCQLRRVPLNRRPVRPDGDFVVYWMTAFRRPFWNFALQQACAYAQSLAKPLLVFEPLRVRYRWASDRLHRCVIEGMRDNQRAFATRNVSYYPYVEPTPGAGRSLLRTLAERACLVVSDDYPCFFLPRMYSAVASSLPVHFEVVDSNGIVPLAAAERMFTVAHSYRRWMQKQILEHLASAPDPDPVNSVSLSVPKGVPRDILKRWPAADFVDLLERGGLHSIPIDHSVMPVENSPGGHTAARDRLRNFIHSTLPRYGELRNLPDCDGSSNLSAALHFGHISAHEVVDAVLAAENWSPEKIGKPQGKNHGFWNTSPSAEAFLDQMLTWRELGFNRCHMQPDYDQYDTLPEWALKTLAAHVDDPRPQLYSLEEFERAETHDELWNASQRQLVREGRIHNYLRMVWGKKILHWTRTPQEALAVMIELNNKYALDGRDPNSYSGIFWVLGRFDRAWGPKRPIFGSVRYMTTKSAMQKVKPKAYLKRFAADDSQAGYLF